MSISIHPYLIARLIAVQAAFMQPTLRGADMAFEAPAVAPTPDQPDWKQLLGVDDEDDGEGGGGGTIRGNRGKNAQRAKEAIRRLNRSGRR